MRFLKTFAVAAGAAAVLGGAGIGVAQASSSSPTVSTSTSSTSHESHARHTGTDDGARGRVAEGETHARHTGTDDPATHDLNDDNGGTVPSSSPTSGTDDHGSGGHGSDD